MSNADRFLGRAEAYALSRPAYPQALGEWLAAQGLLSGNVADIGAGTGLFTRLLLDFGPPTYAVEPNPEMRAELRTALSSALRAGTLQVVDGTSEATGLATQSVGLVTAAQAAHWFDPVPTVQEFRRILQPGGKVLFVWNDWRGIDEPLNHAYRDAITSFYREGENPEHISRVPEAEIPQFMPGGFEKQVFDNPVTLTRQKLHALAGSVSYLPAPHEADFARMTAALDAAFAAHQQRGTAQMMYRTHTFLGSL